MNWLARWCTVAGVILVSAVLVGCVTHAAQRVVREDTEWCNIWIPQADKDDLPRVLLIGDSVTKVYSSQVAQLLEGRAYYARLTTSRCVADPAYPQELQAVLAQYPYRVIHFNNGLHGLGYSEQEYRSGLERTVKLLRRECPQARLIWAQTTPLRPGGPKDHLNARITARNKIAQEIAAAHNVAVNDLHTPMAGHPQYYRDDYHFTDAAAAIQARQVADIVLRSLAEIH